MRSRTKKLLPAISLTISGSVLVFILLLCSLWEWLFAVLIVWVLIAACKLWPVYLLKRFDVVTAEQYARDKSWQIFTAMPSIFATLWFLAIFQIIIKILNPISWSRAMLFGVGVLILWGLFMLVIGHLRLVRGLEEYKRIQDTGSEIY